MKVLIPLLALAFGVAGCKATSDLSVVQNFDSERYLGTWYEVARNDHRFERNMTDVSAAYSRNPDGTIKVINRGYKENQQAWKTIEGVAKFKNRRDEGWLKVSFFGPFYGAYKILHLDENYTEAIVTSSSYRYLWILTRAPDVPEQDLERLLTRAEGFGFERSKIRVVDQSRNVL
jgi:apolipoprotein D and lipocalin family protein